MENIASSPTNTQSVSETSLQIRLKNIWEEVLQVEPLGLEDDFFDIGGSSLLGVQVNSKINEQLGIELFIDVLLDAPTISELTKYILNNFENIKLDAPSMPPLISVKKEPIFESVKINLNSNIEMERSEAPKRKKQTEFSLFFFSADGSTADNNKYQLVLDCAKTADELGFKAIWTPERHFAAFGGLYPNPSVLSAAIAMVTNNLQIRAGSVVLPLQNPIRVAEEWSVVDNLSNGRVGIACASGWHTNDFSLAPENFDNKKETMVQHLNTVQQLWEGQSIQRKNGSGELTDLKIYPRPIQKNLPIWLACHSEETFVLAGKLGANVVTNLFGEQLKNIKQKINAYHQSLADNGFDPDSKTVSLMVHTFIGENLEDVQSRFKHAYRDYLEVNLDLQHKQAKGKGQNLDLKPVDKESIIQNATKRLLNQHGLVGTPESCLSNIEFFKSIGVDEIACLIDFGISDEQVLHSLNYIKELAELTAKKEEVLKQIHF